MNGVRRPYFEVTTPYDGAPQVVCWEDTWVGHISVNRRATEESRQYAVATLSAPTIILPVHSNYIMFVNEDQRSPNSGSPFGVVVDPAGEPQPAVASIGFRRDLLKNVNRSDALWLPPPKK